MNLNHFREDLWVRLKPLLSTVAGFWERYKRNKAAVIGIVLIGFLTVIAIFAPLVATHDPFSMDFGNKYISPTLSYPMGTDHFGRDVFSRVVWGARISLLVGFFAALISGILGICIGSVSGYFGGMIDIALMRLVDMFLVMPTFFLVLLIVALFNRNIWFIILAIAFTSWPISARLLRAEFLSLREREFVEAAKTIGASNTHIIFREILPNAIFPVIVMFGYNIAGAILTEAAISFLGLGDPNTITWGWLLNDALQVFRRAWWLAAFPGVAISITVIAFNLVGDGLNDALNPRLRRR